MTAAPTVTGATLTAPIRVLHVDDDPDLLALSKAFLEREGDDLVVETETDAEVALDRLAEESLDCVVSDYDMPGTDGLEFLAAVRSRYPDLPFILYTGRGSEEIASEAISAGVTDYLQKEMGSEQYAVLANRIVIAVERNRSREELERREESLAKAQRIANLGNWDSVIGEEVLRWSDEVYRIFGVEKETFEPASEAFFEFVHPEDRERVRTELRTAIEGDGVYRIEHRIVRPDGEVRDVQERATVVRDADGDPAVLSGTVQDVTERRTRERQLHELHDSTRAFMEAESTGEVAELTVTAAADTLGHQRVRVYLAAADAGPLAVACERTTGDASFGGRERYAVGEGPVGEAFERGEPVIVSDLGAVTDAVDCGDARSGMYLPIGAYGVLSVSSASVDAFGESDVGLANLLASNAESAMKRVEQTTRLEAFRTAVERSGHAIYWTDVDGDIEYANPAFEALTGYSADAVRGENPNVLKSGVHDDDYYADLWETVLSGEVWEGELVNETRTGERYVADQTIAPISSDGDITRLVAVTNEVERRYHRPTECLETVLDGCVVPSVVVDAEGEVTVWNPAAEALLGWRGEEVADGLERAVDPADEEAYERLLRRAFEGDAVTDHPLTLVARDGCRVEAAVSTAPFRGDPGPVASVALFVRPDAP